MPKPIQALIDLPHNESPDTYFGGGTAITVRKNTSNGDEMLLFGSSDAATTKTRL